MQRDKLSSDALSRKKEFKKKASRLRNLNESKLDRFIHAKHEEAFRSIDCLACANCCKTAGPRLREIDIERIAKHLKISTSEAHSKYTKIDEDGDLVMKTLPCPFLGSDNYCSIYIVRPKACREYPHTDRKNQKSLLSLHIKNTEFCPAVYHIFDDIK
ncbi:MAG: YkgJ family cysteine cluster protein [Bacteroidota bacterium]